MSRPKGKKSKVWTDEDFRKFQEMYTSGKRIEDIAEEFDMMYQTLNSQIHRWKKCGKLPKGYRTVREGKWMGRKPDPNKKEEPKPKKEKTKKVYICKKKLGTDYWEERFIPGKTPIPTNTETVKCTKEISSVCAFGSSQFQSNQCDFCAITGHSRGCPHDECNRFLEVGKEQPRYISNYAMAANQQDFFK